MGMKMYEHHQTDDPFWIISILEQGYGSSSSDFCLCSQLIRLYVLERNAARLSMLINNAVHHDQQRALSFMFDQIGPTSLSLKERMALFQLVGIT